MTVELLKVQQTSGISSFSKINISCQQKNFLAEHGQRQGRSWQPWAGLWGCGWRFLRLLGQPSMALPAVLVPLLERSAGGQEHEGRESWAVLTLIAGRPQHQHP